MTDPILMRWPGRDEPIRICGRCALAGLTAMVVEFEPQSLILRLMPGKRIDDMKAIGRQCGTN